MSIHRQINRIYADSVPVLYDLGYSPLPLSEKQPLIADWTPKFCDGRPDLEEVRTTWSLAWRGANRFDGIGAACHGGLVVIDIDSDEPAVLDRVRSAHTRLTAEKTSRKYMPNVHGASCVYRMGEAAHQG